METPVAGERWIFADPNNLRSYIAVPGARERAIADARPVTILGIGGGVVLQVSFREENGTLKKMPIGDFLDVYIRYVPPRPPTAPTSTKPSMSTAAAGSGAVIGVLLLAWFLFK